MCQSSSVVRARRVERSRPVGAGGVARVEDLLDGDADPRGDLVGRRCATQLGSELVGHALHAERELLQIRVARAATSPCRGSGA